MYKINSLTCRVCLSSESNNCVSLFIRHSDSLISDKICTITNVKIKGDNFPNKICPDCLLELDTAINFKIKCETSNASLLKSSLWDEHKPVKSEVEHNVLFDYIKKEESGGEDDQHVEYEYLVDFYDKVEVNTQSTEIDKKEEIKSSSHITELKEEESQETVNKTAQSDHVSARFECNECGENFKSKCKIRVHWKKAHFYNQLICNSCKRTFKSCKAFNKHKKNPTKLCITASKIRVEGVGAARTYHCKQCTYCTKSLNTMSIHLITHTGERKFSCNMCPKRYTQLNSLRSHYESHGMLLNRKICQVCGKNFKSTNFQRHIRQHNSMYLLQCDHCNKMFKSKEILRQHLKRHSDVKYFTCDKCAKTFYTSAEFRTHHKNVHEKGKHIYKCEHCGYITFRATTMSKHKSRHTDTNIACTKCGKFLENAEKFKDHQKLHYAERKYPCHYCDKKYMNRNGRSNHVVKVHKCTLLNSKSRTKPNVHSAPLAKDKQMIEIEIPKVSKT